MSLGSLPASVIYRLAEKSDSSALDRTRSSAQIQRTVTDFRARLDRVGSVDDVFRDRRLLQFLMDATGNSREMESVGVVRRALTSPDDDKNIAARLNKPQLKSAVGFLGLNNGIAKLKNPETVKELVDAYVSTQHERSLTQGNGNVSRARYFKQNIAAAADDPFKILGDRFLRDVITKTLGLPERIAVQPVETQARAISSRVDLAKFKDPEFTDKFIRRYLTIVDQETAASGGNAAGASALALFGGGNLNDLLPSVNALRTGVNIVV